MKRVRVRLHWQNVTTEVVEVYVDLHHEWMFQVSIVLPPKIDGTLFTLRVQS